ncbi:MAG TPA: hypothetical protein VHD63_20050 [Ktedonobacteraceae bacterium]|nr:hypothetical protein [Ktedonobacteraceae bacterium]
MKKRLVEDLRGSFSMSTGWLFADLLLVLAMLFLAANTMGIHPPPPPVSVTPTPTPQKVLAQLEQKHHPFTIHVNTAALLAGDRNAANSVTRQIAGQAFLQGRSAGLIIVFGRARANCEQERAYDIAQKVYALVHQLGQSDATFSKIADYDALCNIRNDVNAIDVDIFLFVQSSHT